MFWDYLEVVVRTRAIDVCMGRGVRAYACQGVHVYVCRGVRVLDMGGAGTLACQ